MSSNRGLNAKVDTARWLKGMKNLRLRDMPLAIRGTINELATSSADYARDTELPKDFVIRNKWTQGSISPRKGSKIGLIPASQININKMFAEMGSRSSYMAKQESGFSMKDPSVPLSNARTSKSFAKPVARRFRLNVAGPNVRSITNYSTKGTDKKSQTVGMLARSSREGYRGVFYLDVPNMFTSGWYQFKGRTRKGRLFPQLIALRFNYPNITVQKTAWMGKTIKRTARKDVRFGIWRRQAAKLTRKYGARA